MFKWKSNRWFGLILICLALGFTGEAFAKPVKKTLIIYGSIGMGHLAAANGIAADLRARYPHIEIEMLDLKSFLDPRLTGVQNWSYDFLTQRMPGFYDEYFRFYMERGQIEPTLGNMPNGQAFDPLRLKDFLEKSKPDLIFSTFPQAIESLVYLRDRGLFRDIPVGWLHTDLVDETYFARFPLAIDMAFVPTPRLAESWIARGVPADRVLASGMPLNPAVQVEPDPEVLNAFRVKHRLDPDDRTILLIGGSNGVGDFPRMVKSMVKSFSDEPIQIIAVCGRNKKHVRKLTALRRSLPPNVKLIIEGLIPQPDLFNYMRVSHAIISKTGGLTPMELYYRQKILVLLDINGGQEKYNADEFADENLARVIRDQGSVGQELRDLFDNVNLQEDQIERQKRFCKDNCPTKIADWIASNPDPKPELVIPLNTDRDYSRPKGVFWWCVRGMYKVRDYLAK
jgi:processive 1,2-diacylglycerol beta-glucosyltransferase